MPVKALTIEMFFLVIKELRLLLDLLGLCQC